MNFFFSKILIENKKIVNTQYQPAIDVLNKAKLGILTTNGLPAPKLSIQANIEDNEQNRNTLQDGFDNILRAFENVSYMGELRQRWYEIKKLLKGGLPDAILTTMQTK